MKILLVNSLYPPAAVGGAERVVRSLAEGLVADGDDVVVATLTPEAMPSVETIGGVRVRRLPLDNSYWPFGAKPSPWRKLAWHARDSHNAGAEARLLALMAEERPDLVHTHNLAGFSVLAWRAALARGIKVVHTLHDYYLMCPRSTAFRAGRNCTRRCTSCAMLTEARRSRSRGVEAVAGVSRFVLQRHLDAGYFAGARVRRVVLNALTHAAPAGQPARRTPGAPFRIGFLGRVEATKGVELLLQAFDALDRPGATLAIAGAGAPDYVEALKARFPNAGIEWAGVVDAGVFLPSLDVLVVPSLWHEPLGMVAFEAFFHAVPVVAAQRGGLPEVVNARCGLLFDPDDEAALARCLRALIDDPARRRMLADGALEESRRYRSERLVADYRSLYRDVMALAPARFEERAG